MGTAKYLILAAATGMFAILFLLLKSNNVLTPLFALVEVAIQARAAVSVSKVVVKKAAREWVKLYPRHERMVRKEHGNGQRSDVRRSGPGDIRGDAYVSGTTGMHVDSEDTRRGVVQPAYQRAGSR